MSVRYPVLEGKIAERGVRKSAIAKRIGISARALTNKLSGKTSFTWDEVKEIQAVFFPDVDKSNLFITADETQRRAFQ